MNDHQQLLLVYNHIVYILTLQLKIDLRKFYDRIIFSYLRVHRGMRIIMP